MSNLVVRDSDSFVLAVLNSEWYEIDGPDVWDRDRDGRKRKRLGGINGSFEVVEYSGAIPADINEGVRYFLRDDKLEK